MKFARDAAFWTFVLVFAVGMNECLDAAMPSLVMSQEFVLPLQYAIALMCVGGLGVMLLPLPIQSAEMPQT